MVAIRRRDLDEFFCVTVNLTKDGNGLEQAFIQHPAVDRPWLIMMMMLVNVVSGCVRSLQHLLEWFIHFWSLMVI